MTEDKLKKILRRVERLIEGHDHKTTVTELVAEVERLRAALQKISDVDAGSWDWEPNSLQAIADLALEGK